MANALSPRSRAYVEGGGGGRFGGYGNFVANTRGMDFSPDLSNQFAQPGGYGFNPEAGGGGAGYGFGGLGMLGSLFGGTAPSGEVPAGAAGGAGQNAQQELLRGLMELWKQQARNRSPEEERRVADPVGWAIKTGGAPPSAFTSGYFNQPSSYGFSPEQVRATQGNTAANQWRKIWGTP